MERSGLRDESIGAATTAQTTRLLQTDIHTAQEHEVSSDGWIETRARQGVQQ